MKELILGGVRSGKSRLAEKLALESGLPVTYVATARLGDGEMRLRVEAHRARRPAHWALVEEPLALAHALRTHAEPGRCLIVDCLTLWLTQLLCDADPLALARERHALLDVLPALPGRLILIGNETNMGVMPLGELSRRYCDEAGLLHQALARHCERVLLTVAGLPVLLKGDTLSAAEHGVLGPLAEDEAAYITPSARFAAASSHEPETLIVAAEFPSAEDALQGNDLQRSSNSMDWLYASPALPDAEAERQAAARQGTLIKPPGALGQLEALAIKLAGLQGTPLPAVERVRIVLFAGDHGVAEEGVSAFPQSVTTAMLRCFATGGAAISVLARELGAELEVLDLGTVDGQQPVPGIIDARMGAGTANFTLAPAMTEHQLARALHTGRHAAERAKLAGTQLFIGGEMGIANTTAATALAAALLGEAPEILVGPGAGLAPDGLAHKVGVIRRALARHDAYLKNPWEVLRRLGGFEIAGLAGAYIACGRMGLPVLVDGFICTAAALAAERLCPDTRSWFIYSHVSAEPGHRRVLQALQGDALLDLGMRLGEGSGAAAALPLLRLACSLHNNMATFAEAGVAGKIR